MNKFWQFVKNETGERELRISGVIIDDDFFAWLFGGTTPNEFRSELNSGEGDITVWINSEGGNTFAAAQIYNMLKEYKGKVTVKIDAIAASAASVIAMAGDEIQISPVGMMMIHNPWLSTQGDAEEMKTAARFLEDVKESILNAYELKTKLPREQIAQMMDDETWFHAQKAVELGFADKIIGAENQTAENNSAVNISSRRQVMNCMANVLKAKCEAESKNAVTDIRAQFAQLRERLNRLEH